MRRRNFIALCGASALAGALPTGSRAGEGGTMGQLEPSLLLGEEGPWQGAYDQGYYRLSNATGFNNGRLISTTAPENPQRIFVDVAPFGSGAYCGAGLVVNRVEDTGGWLGVSLQPNGALGIYLYDAQNGLERVAELPAQGLDPKIMTRLTLENSTGGIDILTNDQKCGSFSDVKLKGACGIVAFDIGNFYFASFWMG